MLHTLINDSFTKLNISRQRKWQMRQAKKNLCTVCGKPKANATHCAFHAQQQASAHRERWRKANKAKRRYISKYQPLEES